MRSAGNSINDLRSNSDYNLGRSQEVSNSNRSSRGTIYDEFEPPGTPPPGPPEADFSQTIMFEMAPPPPMPLAKQRSMGSLDTFAEGKGTKSSAVLPQPTHPKPKGVITNSSGYLIKSASSQSLGPPTDVLLPPNPPPRNGLKKSIPSVAIDSTEGLDEVDFGEDSEAEIRAEEVRRRQLVRQSHMIKFDEATVDDFDDLDSLLNDLDHIYNQKSKAVPSIYDRTGEVDRADSTSGLTILDDNIDAAVSSIETMNLPNDKSEPYSRDARVHNAMVKINEANVKKITTRIYIQHSKVFKTIILTSLMTTGFVVSDLKRRCALEDTQKWSLFEVINDVGIERPLREFEIVTDVIKTWSVETVNALLLKQYKYRDSLTIKELKDVYPRMCGWLFLETKKRKMAEAVL
eukprot:Partr_v1_DN28974_c0_g1_i3_m25469